ncbi:DUF6869 domain-containing protein [Cupriavidus metallidurans]|uniref:DUF6869 domain-containing protein n=1 Tax=Cupriavidus metallidurans TaxID=119219 RepID=UPI003D0476DE
MPLPPEDIEAWALAYIAARETYDHDSDEELPLAISRFYDLDADPEDVWMVILHVLSHCPSEKVLSVLAADQLEDLIEDHGEAMIDRIERETQSNPAFKNLLCGVWPSSSKEIWARVEKARGYSELPPKKVLGLIDCSPRNPAIRDQAAVLASIENELSMAMLANGYLTNSPFRLVGIYVHFDGPPGSHALAREWITSGMSIVTTIAFSRETMFLLDPESQRIVIRDAILVFLRKVAFAFGLPSRFLSHDAT